MTTINTPAGPITPTVVEHVESSQQSGNVIHVNLAGGTDVTLRPAGLRSGRFRFLFSTLAAADACRRAHALVGVCSLNAPEAPSYSMNYVTDGEIAVELEHDGAWWVAVAFREVVA